MPTKIHELNEFGQSVWLDNISRHHLKSGKLKEMIRSGISGITSNPSIFNKSISETSDYDGMISKLVGDGRSAFDIYDELTIRDVQDAADLFREVYEFTDKRDGYISLEVSPKLAYKTAETVSEARRLFGKVNRKNLLIKVPATEQGIPAIRKLISDGINVNATLIFSIAQYNEVANAYIAGLRDFVSKGGDPQGIASVASVFISRTDTCVDKILDDIISKEKSKKADLEKIKGKAAVAYTKLIYKEYDRIFKGREFDVLKLKGARPQRALWASTSTKNPSYSDIKYVVELIGKDTVNTLPDPTYYAFMDHGIIKEAIKVDLEGAKKALSDLKRSGIDVDKVCEQLLKDGVDSFEKAFDSLLSSIEQKKLQLVKR